MDQEQQDNNLRRWLQEAFDVRYISKIEFLPVKLIAYGSVGLVAAATITGVIALIFK